MKAQASLEMVVGLIILLVVAGVVIGLVIHFINPQNMPNPGEKLSITEFLTDCGTYCEDISSVEYCRSYYSGNDWDKDGVKHELMEVGAYNWQTCEDRVYCFLVKPCEDRFGRGLDVIRKCKIILCQTYFEKYGNITLATEGVNDDINFPPVCDMSSIQDEDNWYNQVFSQGCSMSGGSTTTTIFTALTLSDCVLDAASWEIACDTNCNILGIPDGSIVVSVEDETGGQVQVMITNNEDGNPYIPGPITFDNGKIIFTTDPSLSTLTGDKSNWKVTLVCSNPDGFIWKTGV